MFWRIRYFCKWIAWLWKGKPVVIYNGYNCGCCGRWIEEKFSIPTYQSVDRYSDTIGLCKNQEDCFNNYF
jgi:hypothetical protein